MEIEGIVMITCTLLFTGLLVTTGVLDYMEHRDKLDECKLLEGTCDYYSCMGERQMTYDGQRNYLLKQQNCILEGMK